MKMSRMILFIFALLIEVAGIATVFVGVAYEYAVGGPIYLVVITVGSCIVAVGGLIVAKVLPILMSSKTPLK